MAGRHGPLPSPYLLEYSRHFGRKSLGRARDRLTDLFHEENTPHGGRYLDKPAAQFPSLPGGYLPRDHTNIYSINACSLRALRDAGRYVEVGHGGWWEHQLGLACALASIELATFDYPHSHSFRGMKSLLIAASRLLCPSPMKGEDIRTNSFLISFSAFAMEPANFSFCWSLIGRPRWFLRVRLNASHI